MKTYFYRLLHKYVSLYIRPGDAFIDIHPQTDRLLNLFHGIRKAVIPERMTEHIFPSIEMLRDIHEIPAWKPDYLLLNGNIHYERDIQQFLQDVRQCCDANCRMIVTYYSSLWRPFITLATRLKLRDHTPENNWIAHEDMENFLLLSDFEPVRRNSHILFPFYLPLLSNFINRYIAPLPFFRQLCMLNILIARPINRRLPIAPPPSVSIVVAARNEAGNIEQLITRLPKMGPDDELIFVEGHSQDNTWTVIQEMARKYAQTRTMKIAQQHGTGKGDAVRTGFDMASKEILMILDADLTVSPEDLPKFYHAIVTGKGEFINGSRLVYPMEEKAMRFFNMIGNKFFAVAFSFMLGQRFKDTLCGTKVLSRTNYRKIANNRSYFGDFDPFGDFDLLFGASRIGLRIVEIPIMYKERTYGHTNIQRWRHGVILLRMLLFAARKIKFI